MSDISTVVNECINYNFVKPFIRKRKYMSYQEKEKCEKYFARMIGYCSLFKDSKGIVQYLSIQDKDKQIEFIKNKIAEILNIPHNEITDREDEILMFIYNNYFKNGYVYRGCNSKTISDIEKYGLKGTSFEEKNELRYIDSIFKKYGSINPLGWGSIDLKNNRDGWFYSGKSKDMLYYADSPEWLGQLCGGNTVYSYLIPEENRSAYANRDYDSCLANINAMMNKYNMIDSDKSEVINFFNKCWSIYGNSDPCLMFIPIKELWDEERINKALNVFLDPEMKRMFYEDVILGEIPFFGHDVCCDKEIKPDNLLSVNLSPILPRFKISEDSIKKEMTISEIIKKLNGLDMDSLIKAQEFLEQFPVKEEGKVL